MSQFFINRPIVAMVISIVIVIVGVVSMIGLPIAQYPELTPPMVQVKASYTGANALNVEQSVATPLEQKINGVENSIYMQSINTNDGAMTIKISFEIGTDPDMDNVLTQNRVSSALPMLPEEVKRLGVTTEKSMAFPLLLIAINSPAKTYNRDFLSNFAKINVVDYLARIPGVGKADALGSSDYAMRIWVRPGRLSQLGITVPEITSAVRAQNIIVPGGSFGAEPAPPGTDFTYNVRLKDRLQTEEEFRDIVIRTNPDGSQVKLRDVARVELGVENYKAFTRFNGEETALIAIYQSPGSNALEVANNIKSTMVDISKSFPEDIEYVVSLDTTKAITEGIKEIVITLLQALLLVILVVFIFLQNFRATIIPTLAIPVSLVGAFTLFPILGFSINTLSLLGIVLAIGIVVDDAIVVVEAVTAYLEQGLSPKEATKKAMKDVSGPVVATTLVLVAVFVPVAAMGGITGLLYQQFAITIAVSVVFSSINALTLSPALSSMLLRPQKKSVPGKKSRNPLTRFFNGFNKVFDKTTESYLSFASIMARKLMRSVILVVVVVFLTGVLGKMVPSGFVPEEDMGYFFVNVQLPDAASLQRTDAVAMKVEEILKNYEGVDYVSTATGFSLLTGGLSTNTAFFFVTLKDWGDRSKEDHVFDILRRVNRDFFLQISEARAFAFGPPAIQGLGTGSGFSIMIQDKGGNTPQYLAENTSKFIEAANKRPEIGRAFTTYTANVPQRLIDIDREKAMKLGLSLQDVYTTIGAFLGGSYVNDFNRFGRVYKSYIQSEPEFRLKASDLKLFSVKNANGEMVPLSAIAKVESATGPEYTFRFNMFRAAEVTGSPAPGYSSAQALTALEEVAAEVLPQDMTFAWNAMSYQEKKASGTGSIVFIFSLVFVFLILAGQYESWSLPFSIILGIPFAIFGAFLGLWLARMGSESYLNNIFAQIAFILLIALAAKNAILVVEFAKLKFESGLSLFEAAVESAKQRFRPILMTAFSFVLGVIPLLVATGAGAEARKVMGVAVFSGLLIATIIGVFLYPALFVLIGKIAGYEKKRPQTKAIEENSSEKS